jgi:seryl-tRNA synthetase
MVQHSLDRNADAYEEIRPPTLVRTDTMVSTGHLPKFEEEAYHMERDDLWAIPTAEVPLTSLHRDEVLDAADLPLRYTAHTSCFRREAGAAGRDTRGLLRVHEFDKVELLTIADGPEQAIACHEDVLARSEAVLTDLGLPYRVVDLCTGDVGASAARTWDLEAYAPGCDMWLEVSSVSWFADYQARRANIRYRTPGSKGTEVCHTVNGSAMGWPRTVAAYLETHRQADGSIAVVDCLRPYLGGAETFAGRR